MRTLKFRDLHAPYQLVDARDALLWGLRKLGHEASEDSGDRQIVLAAQLCTPETDKTIPNDSIIWNLEQAGNYHFPPEYQTLMRRCTVWDYNHVNMERMKSLYGIDTKYVPMGWVPELERRQEVAEEYDVMFVGSLVARRREKIIDDLRHYGLKVFTSNICYGYARDVKLYQSKVFLNMHFHKEMVMESLRCGFGMANKRAVVCEVNAETAVDPELVPGMLCVPYDHLVEACAALAHDKELREEYGMRGYETFKKRPMWEVLEAVL